MSGLVFISYARDDGADQAEQLEQWIEEEVGYPAFYDKRSIGTGHKWKTLIRNSLQSSFAVIVLLSQASVKSTYVTFEWSYAQGLGKYILPLHIDPDLNPKDINDFLTETQYDMEFINPTDEDWKKLLNRLIELHDLSDVPDEVQRAAELACDPRRENQIAAIELLSEYPHDSATHELRKLATNDTLQARQIDAAIALSMKTEYKDESAIDGLKRAVQNHIHKKDSIALECLKLINTPKSASVLHEVIVSDEPNINRKRVLSALLHMKTDNLSDIFKDLLQSDTTYHRLEIIKYLHKANTSNTVEVIIFELNREGIIPEAKATLFDMLSTYEHESIADMCFEAIEKHYPEVYRYSDDIVQFALIGLVKNTTIEHRNKLHQFINYRGIHQNPLFNKALNEMNDKLS